MELRLIEPLVYKDSRANWLWEHVRKQDACFDDLACDENGEPRGDLFAERLTSPQTVAFEVGDAGLILFGNITPRLGASIHFFSWEDVPEPAMHDIGVEAIAYVMDAYLLRRLSAAPPEFNRLAKRLAIDLGFQFEGRLRQAFLKHGRYWDVLVYGLLKEY